MVKEVIKELTNYLGTILVVAGIIAIIYSALNSFPLIKIDNLKTEEKNLKYLLTFIIISLLLAILSFSIIVKKIFKELRAKRAVISPLSLFTILVVIFVILVLLIKYGVI